MHDLLTDELIGVRTPAGERQTALPGLLAALARGEVDGYTGLRAHQADPWHVFLVQLAASILARAPRTALPTDPAYWHDGLLGLADGQATAWSLVVEDVTKPAFLQHPWRSWEAEAKDYGVEQKRGVCTFQAKASFPDEIDVLVTSKNHDVKMSRIDGHDAQAWLYALLLYQTMSGFLGAGNYGSVRMNGGFGSRPILSWARDAHPSRRFCDEVGALQTLRDAVVAGYGYRQHGIALTWLTRWERSGHQHQLQDLEPWFIEAVRPVRLRTTPDGTIIALGATSKARQIGPKSVESGDVGDPWIPIKVLNATRSALTLSGSGFTPERLTELLFRQGFELTALQQAPSGGGTGWLVGSALVRGQGKTEGYHRVELPVPQKAASILFKAESRATLAHLAQSLLSDAKDVQKALGTALTVFAEGGPDKADFDRDAVKRWIERSRDDFGQHWRETYFPTLWRGADEDHASVRGTWQQDLVNRAQVLLDLAAMRLPLPSNRYWRSVTQAQSALRGMLHKLGLPFPAAPARESHESIEESNA